MAQLISTTDLKGIRPIFADGYSENIKKYQQLKKLFELNQYYRIFAEPIISGEQKISWHTEYEGNIIPYPKLSDEDKEFVKSRLKIQVNRLYISILDMFADDIQKVKKLFNLIDTCLEIPDYYDIFIVQAPNGERNFVLTRWGFMSESYHKPRQIIASIIPIKVNTLYIKVIKGNNIPVKGQKVFIKFLSDDQEKEFITDDNATIVLEDAPLLEKFQIYIKDENGNKLYVEEFTVGAQQNIVYHIDSKNLERQQVIIQVIDTLTNKPLTKTPIDVQYEDLSQSIETNESGEINLGELYINTEVNLAYKVENKIVDSFSFQVEKNKKIYTFHITKGQNSGEFKLKVVDNQNNPIGNAIIEIKFNGTIQRATTDSDGIVIFKNIPLNKEITVRQIINNLPQFQKTIKFSSEKQIFTFIGQAIAEQDYINVNLTVVDKKNNPIKNLRVSIDGDIRSYSKITDQNGKAYFKNIYCKQNLILKIEYKGSKIHQPINCQNKNLELKIVLENKFPILLILGILLGLILVLGLIFFVPNSKLFEPKPKPNIVDTAKTDTLKPFEGFILYVYKDTNKTPAQNVQITIQTKDNTFKAITDSLGIIKLAQLKDYKGNITIIINDKKFPKQIFTFKYEKQKEIYLKQYSKEESEIILPCDTLIKSHGYHSTIKSFNLKKTQGVFLLYYITYQIPDKFVVYKGSIRDTSKQNILWESPFQSGEHFRKIPFQAPDSIITVRVIGGDTTKTEWAFKVFCPKK